MAGPPGGRPTWRASCAPPPLPRGRDEGGAAVAPTKAEADAAAGEHSRPPSACCGQVWRAGVASAPRGLGRQNPDLPERCWPRGRAGFQLKSSPHVPGPPEPPVFMSPSRLQTHFDAAWTSSLSTCPGQTGRCLLDSWPLSLPACLRVPVPAGTPVPGRAHRSLHPRGPVRAGTGGGALCLPRGGWRWRAEQCSPQPRLSRKPPLVSGTQPEAVGRRVWAGWGAAGTGSETAGSLWGAPRPHAGPRGAGVLGAASEDADRAALVPATCSELGPGARTSAWSQVQP